MNEFFKTKIIPPLMDSNLNGVLLMSSFALAWENSKVAIKWIQRLFRSIDTGIIYMLVDICVSTCLFDIICVCVCNSFFHTSHPLSPYIIITLIFFSQCSMYINIYICICINN